MIEHGLPALYVLLLWWASTGAVLYVVGMPSETFRSSVTLASAVLVIAIFAISRTTNVTTTASAYVGFSAALAVWGWNEVMFLTGAITGPRTSPLPQGTVGLTRLWSSVEVVIYHELAIFLCLLGITALTRDQPNQIAFWTFLVLWVMRLSAKFNVYLGVPNLAVAFLPDHLKYIGSYFQKRTMNLLFPVAVTASTAAAVWLIWLAIDATTQFAAVSHSLVATLLVLAVVEHWFMVLPLPSEQLWAWGLTSRIHPTLSHAKTHDCPSSTTTAEPGLA